jgi:hypothetical protein
MLLDVSMNMKNEVKRFNINGYKGKCSLFLA